MSNATMALRIAVEEQGRLRAELAKAQARCAELEAAIRDSRDNGHWSRAHAALASDGTSALAAVRLAQRELRQLKVGDASALGLAAIQALAQAFGEGE